MIGKLRIGSILRLLPARFNLGLRLLACMLLPAAVATGCAASHAPAAAPPAAAPPGAIETTLFLIGDAGHPARGGEPVFIALAAALAAQRAPAIVAFLGDNLYPAGLPDSTDAARAEMERRLDAQIDVVRQSGARCIFIPGNHDWAREKRDGWAAIRRQARHIAAAGGGPRIVMLPRHGCPGPVVEEVGDNLRLVILDSQWWLHEGPKPTGPDSGCDAASEEEVTAALAQATATAGARHVVVLAHHPLISGGRHGGHFGWQDHLFPLHTVKSWLLIPLPGIGSLYPLLRKRGIAAQDQASAEYRHMLAALEGAIAAHPPLVWASGHEHTLEVHTTHSARYQLVSGAGYYGHAAPTSHRDATLFAASASGFMRLDVLGNGRVRLGVFTVDAQARAHEVFARYLDGR